MRPELLQQKVYTESVNARVVDVPFTTPVHLPFGEIRSRPSIVVETHVRHGDDRVRGVSEGASLPMQIPMYDDYTGNLEANSRRVADELLGEELSLDEVRARIARVALGGSFATARMTVETSILDAMARARHESVYSMLTGDPTPREGLLVPYGKSITEVGRDELLAACHEAVSRDARRLKFKISPASFDGVYPALRELMRQYPDKDFMVDANGMFDPAIPAHVDMLRALDQLGMMTIEEPVSRAGGVRGLAAHRALQDIYRFDTPITIDDAVKTGEDAEAALREELADIINLKPGRVGSFLRCVDIAHLAADMDKQVMVGGMFEATPGRYMTTTLAAYCLKLGFTIAGDLSLPNERLTGDIGSDRLHLVGGNIDYKPKQGWGYDIETI